MIELMAFPNLAGGFIWQCAMFEASDLARQQDVALNLQTPCLKLDEARSDVSARLTHAGQGWIDFGPRPDVDWIIDLTALAADRGLRLGDQIWLKGRRVTPPHFTVVGAHGRQHGVFRIVLLKRAPPAWSRWWHRLAESFSGELSFFGVGIDLRKLYNLARRGRWR